MGSLLNFRTNRRQFLFASLVQTARAERQSVCHKARNKDPGRVEDRTKTREIEFYAMKAILFLEGRRKMLKACQLRKIYASSIVSLVADFRDFSSRTQRNEKKKKIIIMFFFFSRKIFKDKTNGARSDLKIDIRAVLLVLDTISRKLERV